MKIRVRSVALVCVFMFFWLFLIDIMSQTKSLTSNVELGDLDTGTLRRLVETVIKSSNLTLLLCSSKGSKKDDEMWNHGDRVKDQVNNRKALEWIKKHFSPFHP